MRKEMVAGLFLALLVAGCGSAQKPAQEPPKGAESQEKPAAQQPVQQESGNRKSYTEPPKMALDPAKKYTATMETSLGTMKIELFAADAPVTVNNFIFLAREGFYEGTKFHRIIRDFMIQGGDPLGTGGGGPGYKFNDELPPKRPYTRGMLAMANSGPNTNGSQFFICTVADCGGLDQYPKYTQFGQVVEGLDVLDKLAAVEVVRAPNSPDPVPSLPKDAPTITKLTIAEE